MGGVTSTPNSVPSSTSISVPSADLPSFDPKTHDLRRMLVFGDNAMDGSPNSTQKIAKSLVTVNCSAETMFQATGNLDYAYLGHRVSAFARNTRHATDRCAMLFFNALRREEFASGWLMDVLRVRDVQFVASLEYLPRIPRNVLECVEGVVVTPHATPECVRRIHAKFNLAKRLKIDEAEFVATFHKHKESKKSIVVDLVGDDLYAMNALD